MGGLCKECRYHIRRDRRIQRLIASKPKLRNGHVKWESVKRIRRMKRMEVKKNYHRKNR